MKKTALLGAIAALALVACQSTTGIPARIQEKSAVFSRLTDAQQRKIEKGVIEVGYTTDMVYMALGQPQKIREEKLPEGRETTWIYENFALPTAMVLLRPTHPSRHGLNPVYAATNTSISFGGRGGPEPSVDAIPDLPTETLHVIFINGVVFEMKVAR